jgi:small-conductance mechanosensitive channel
MRSTPRKWFVFGAVGFLLAAAPSASPTNARDVVAHLEQTITWYRHVTAEQDSASGASDILLRDSTHEASTKALQLGFDFARAEAALVSDTQDSSNASKSGAGAGSGNLQQASSKAVDRVNGLVSRIADLDAKIPKSAGRARTDLTAQRKELQVELDLAKEIQATLQDLVNFSGTAGSVTGGLNGRIEELERSIPEARHQRAASKAKGSAPSPGPASTTAPAAGSAAQQAPARAFQPDAAGIISLATELFSIHSSRRRVQDLVAETDALVANIDRLRTPLIDEARNSIKRSDEIANAAASQNADQIAAGQNELTGLVTHFKQLSGAVLPLGEQAIAVGVARGNLEESVAGFDRQSKRTSRYLLLRAGMLTILLLVVLVVSEVWRRAILRYVTETRRRRQFLVLRRVVVTCAVLVVLTVGFVTEFGSFATYAGFVTAGVAVALQNPILSVVGYFFLIGRYGFRVGDRVTISGVTGDVLDIGLVRIYLMELSSAGSDAHVTGRIVVFANAVVFQPAALYKQMPGIDYVWHAITLTLTPDTDFQLVESKLTEAVDAVYGEYRTQIEKEYATLQQNVDVDLRVPRPESRVQFNDSGVQFTVRYPAEMKQASTTDDRMLKALSDAIAAEPKFQFVPAGRPRVQTSA